jgi:serine/threonine protein kinase
MFPWASKDLRTYWESYAECNETCFKWLLEQCHGIVEALTSIHRYQTTSATSIASTTNLSSSNPNSKFGSQESNEDLDQRNAWSLWGRHGDITPTNILFFPDQSQDGKYGTLKLADFGAARFSYDDTITKEDKCNVPGSRAYCSPEWRLPDGKPTVQCDVWALGCIFLEFVCWYFDYRYLKGFERERLSVDDTAYFFSFLMPDKPRPGVAWVKKPVSEVRHAHDSHTVTEANLFCHRCLQRCMNAATAAIPRSTCNGFWISSRTTCSLSRAAAWLHCTKETRPILLHLLAPCTKKGESARVLVTLPAT